MTLLNRKYASYCQICYQLECSPVPFNDFTYDTFVQAKMFLNLVLLN